MKIRGGNAMAASRQADKHTHRQSHSRRLRRGLIVLSVAWLWLLAAGFILIALSADPGSAAAWTGKVALVMAYQLLFILHNRDRILDGPNLAHLWGTANLLTLVRGTLAAVLAGFLFSDKPTGPASWLPALLYTVLAGLDYLDGYWARRTGTRTAMGEILDQEYDALGILLAVSLAVQFGHLPAVFLCVGLARYAFAGAAAWRRRRGLPVRPLPPSYLRRRLAGFQMAVLAVFLWPVAGPPGTVLAGLIVGVPFLLGFARDWLIVSGNLDPEDRGYLKARALFYRITRTWLPPILRILLLAVAAAVLREALQNAAQPGALPLPWVPAFLPRRELLAVAYTASRVLLLLLLSAGRFNPAAALLLALEGMRIFLYRLDLVGAAAAGAALLLYLLASRPLHPGITRTPTLGAPAAREPRS